MKSLKVLYIILVFSLLSCTTIKFGHQETIIFDEEEKPSISELDLSYSYKVMGVPVKGSKSIVENIFLHPDNKTLFICLSFPKIGILKTEDGGKTFKEQFFKLGYLEKAYGYSAENNEDDKNKEQREGTPFRFFYHFAVSPKDPDKIAVSMGPYLLLSADRGKKWEVKNIFFDMQNTNIRDIFITDEDKIVVLSENKISVSSNWGKRWDRKTLKIGKTPFFKLEYISGLYDNKSDILFASIKFDEEPDQRLSKSSYDLLYSKAEIKNKSGVYISKDAGTSWSKTKLDIPLVFWENKGSIYGAPIYPLSFYSKKFSQEFIDSDLYKDAKLDDTTKNISEYVENLLGSSIEENMILSAKQNKIIKFDKDAISYKQINETNFENIYQGILELQDLDHIQWKKYWYDKKKSSDFAFEYNFWRIFKLWTGYRSNSPYLYRKTDSGTFFRIIPHEEFLKRFIKYAVEKQININSKNPFLKKKTDIEIF